MNGAVNSHGTILFNVNFNRISMDTFSTPTPLVWKRSIRMMLRISVFLIVVHSKELLYAQQVDSLRDEILRYEEPKYEIIGKGRKMLFDKFVKADTNKVRELINYLKQQDDSVYMALHISELWMLSYWMGSYEQVNRLALDYEKDFEKPERDRIYPPPDAFYNRVREELRKQRIEIKQRIQSSPLSLTDKDFSKIFFDFVVSGDDYPDIKRDTLNREADEFLFYNAHSRYDDIVRKRIRFVVVPSVWGYGFEFFSGYGAFTNKLEDNFRDCVPFGVAFDIFYGNLGLYLRDFIGFGSTRHDVQFPSGIWAGGAQTRVFLPEASLGYSIFENHVFKIAPFAGVAWMHVTPTDADKEKHKEYENVGIGYSTSPAIGITTDIKLGSSGTPIVSSRGEQSFWFLRIRYAYTMPRFESPFTGAMHYLTIGFGGFGRTLHRDM